MAHSGAVPAACLSRQQAHARLLFHGVTVAPARERARPSERMEGGTPSPTPAPALTELQQTSAEPGLSAAVLLAAYHGFLGRPNTEQTRTAFAKALGIPKEAIVGLADGSVLLAVLARDDGYHVVPNPLLTQVLSVGPHVKKFYGDMTIGREYSEYKIVEPTWIKGDELKKIKFNISDFPGRDLNLSSIARKGSVVDINSSREDDND